VLQRQALEDYLNQKFVNRWIAGGKQTSETRPLLRPRFLQGGLSSCRYCRYTRYFIYPLSLSDDMSTGYSKVSYSQSAIYCFLLQFSVSCLSLKVTRWLLTSCSSFSRHFYPSLYISFNNMFQKALIRKMRPIQLGFLLFIVCIYLSWRRSVEPIM
jgi:hypothetical protein